MSQHTTTTELPRSSWSEELRLLTHDHEGDDITIEVNDREYGDQIEAARMPLAYLEYDPKDDTILIAVRSRGSRDPAVIRMIEHPQRVMMADSPDQPGPVLDIVERDGTQTLVWFQPHPMLPPRAEV